MLSREFKIREDRVRQEFQCDREDEIIKQQHNYDQWFQGFQMKSKTKLQAMQQQTDEWQEVQSVTLTIKTLKEEIDGF